MTPTERFFAKVSIDANDDACWLWKAGVRKGGYGAFYFNGKMESAHVVSYILHYGQRPSGLMVCHHCDNPRCVNPAHLFLGTRNDNAADMRAKGRSVRGSQAPRSKLTEIQAREIHRLRESGLTLRAIAEQFGVTSSSVGRICQGKDWKYLNENRSSP